MNILMTADTIGGVWTYALDLIAGLAAHDARAVLATMGRPLSPDQHRQIESLENVQLRESAFRLEWMSEPWEDVRAASLWLLRLEDEFQPDVVHLNNYCHSDLNWTAPVLTVGHSCVCSWMKAVRHRSPGPDWQEYRDRVRSGLQASDLVVAPTAGMLRELDHFYGPFPRTRVIYNGRAVTAHGHRDREPFILSAGRLWDDAKNIALLTAIADQIDWPVVVAGSTVSPDDGRELGHGGTTCVRFLGQVRHQDMQDLFARAAIYALPAKYEPFGLSILEAAINGCALVLADIETLRELWDGAALFASPEDPRAWRDALSALAADPRSRKQLAVAAQRRAQNYSASKMAADYYGAYVELVGRRISSGHFSETGR